jgi:arylsulfatase A-like enzyme
MLLVLAPPAIVVLLASVWAGSGSRAGDTPERHVRPLRPNVVFVLADDLSWDLVRFMPEVRRMQRDGTTFTRYFVADSLCCSSRATILTGQFPHNTGVQGNGGPNGGYRAFLRKGAWHRGIGLGLHAAGYRTGLLGKYLNHYHPKRDRVPAGWDTWAVGGWGYPGFGYTLNEDGRSVHYGHAEADYLTDVLRRHAVDFIDRSGRSRQPFFLEVAPFMPHSPYVPAPRHRALFAGLALPRHAGFDAQTTHAPSWLSRRPRLTPAQIAMLTRVFRRRARAVQAIDELIGAVRAAVRREGLDRDTYIVFSSDNGLHLGEHRLLAGKTTAFESDIRVPLVVVGPGVRAGRRMRAITGNVDLAPTFLAIAGARRQARSRDGRSLLRLLHGRRHPGWRRAMLIEHQFLHPNAGDPDAQAWAEGTAPTYRALRMAHSTYVEYADGGREYYDMRSDPGQVHNRAARLGAARVRRLHLALRRYERCVGMRSCAQAGAVTGPPVSLTRGRPRPPLPPRGSHRR